MDPIIDEFFIRIKELEKKNEGLKASVQAKEKELDSFKDQRANVIELEHIPKQKGNIFNSVDNNTLLSVCKRAISFSPLDNNPGIMKILGDFTNWEPREMINLGGNLYSYEASLLEGYTYYYSFIVRDETETIVDFNSPYEINIKSGNCNNFITIPSQISPEVAFFDYAKDQPLLEAFKKIENRKQFSTQDRELFDNIVDLCTFYREQNTKIQEEIQIKEKVINDYYK